MGRWLAGLSAIFSNFLAILPAWIALYGILVLALSGWINGIPIWLLPLIFLGAFLVAVLAFRPCSKKAASSNWLQAYPYLVLLPSIAAVLFSPRIQISYHGFFHSAYVTQILQGHIPPENVTLPGYPADDYWPYHAILAVLWLGTHWPVPFLSAVLNLLILASCFYVIRQILLGLFKPFIESNRILISVGPLFVLFCGNILYAPAGLASEAFHRPFWGGDLRLISLSEKFLNFNAFPIGVLLFLSLLDLTLRFLEDEKTARSFLLEGALLTLGGLAVHATSGIFMALVVPAALALTWARTGKGRLPVLHWWDACLLTAFLPFAVEIMRFLITAARELEGKTHVGFNLFDLFSVFLVFAALVPFFLKEALAAWKYLDEKIIFLSSVTCFGYLFALTIKLPDGNEYKFIFLATITAGFVAMASFLRPRPSFCWKKRLIFGIVAMVFLNLLALGAAQYERKWFRDGVFTYRGGEVDAKMDLATSDSDVRFCDVYRWARESTPTDTILVLPLFGKNNLSAYILAERLPFLVDGDIYNRGLKEYDRRLRLLQAFYQTFPRVKDWWASFGEIREALPGRSYVFLVPGAKSPHGAPKEERPAFQGKFATAYYFPPIEQKD